MKFLSYLLVFIFSMQISNGIIINEIMYNPTGSDNNKEFIEIFSYPQINLSNYIISDGDSNDTLILSYFNDKSNYSLIVEDDYLIKTNNASIYKIGATIGNGLSSNDIISFYGPNGNIIDSVEINSSIANGNGYSISYYNGSWAESQQINGTPGYQNSVKTEITPPAEETKNIILETYLDETIYINTEYTKLFKIKIENKDSCSEKDTIIVSYNITNPALIKQDEFTKEVGCSSYASTGEFTVVMPGNYTLCGTIIDSTINETDLSDNSACMDFTVIDTSAIPCNIAINITTNETLIYEAGQSIKFKNLLNNETFPFIIEYWIEDFFGSMYKNQYNTTNTNQKSWKTNIAEQDRVLFIKSVVYPNCNDSNLTDNSAEKMFIVKSESNEFAENSEDSILEITEVDDKVKFGDTADIKVNIYKGNTNKYSISLWVEDNGKKVSETTKIHLYDKYSSYHGQLPIKLDSNCNEKLKDGKYDVVIKGLDKKDKKEIKIEGIKSSLCSKSSSSSPSSSTSSKKSSAKNFNFELADFNEVIEPGKAFKTKLTLDNNNNQDINIKVWSYVYRGSKSYSGDREENMEEFILKRNSLQTIELSNIVADAKPGDYKIKVVVNKNNQKTNNEITKNIKISSNAKNIDGAEDLETIDKNENNKITNNLVNYGQVYESSTEKAKNLAPLFIIILSVLLNIFLIWRR